MIYTAMGAERLFPPRRCQEEIPKKTITKVLSSSDKTQYLAKEKEYATPPPKRRY